MLYDLDQLCLICGTLSPFAVGKIDHSRESAYINSHDIGSALFIKIYNSYSYSYYSRRKHSADTNQGEFNLYVYIKTTKGCIPPAAIFSSDH